MKNIKYKHLGIICFIILSILNIITYSNSKNYHTIFVEDKFDINLHGILCIFNTIALIIFVINFFVNNWENNIKNPKI